MKKIIHRKSLKQDVTASVKIDYRRAEKIADDIEDLLNNLHRMDDVSDYLSNDDLSTLGEACDILHDFAQMYAHQ